MNELLDEQLENVTGGVDADGQDTTKAEEDDCYASKP